MKTNKKWRKISLGISGFVLIANPIIFSMTTLQSHAKDLYYSTDNKQYDKQLDNATDKLNEAKKTGAESDIKEAIDTIINLPYSQNYKKEEKEKLINSLSQLIGGLKDKDLKEKYQTYLVDKAVKRVNDSLLYPDYDIANQLVQSLSDEKLKAKYSSILEKTKNNIDKKIINDNLGGKNKGVNTPPIDFSKPVSVAPYKNVDTGNYLPGSPSFKTTSPKPPKDALPEKKYTEHVQYETIGNSCYKVTTQTVNGKKVVKKEKVSGAEAYFCPVYVESDHIEDDYDFSKVSPAPPGVGDNIGGGKMSDGASYFTNGENILKNTQAKVLTLQFTLDRTVPHPHYYETDIQVGKNNTITYQQQKDVLYQIAIRSGGKTVEDKNRLLVLLENKIIVVENKGDNIPVSSFDILLKGFKAQVKAMERQVGKS